MFLLSRVQKDVLYASWLIFFVSSAHSLHAERVDGTAIIPTYITKLFESHEFRYTGGKYTDQVFPYRLFVPQQTDDNVTYPLLVWTNGLGECGNDNTLQLMHQHLLFEDETFLEKNSFFVLAVQSPPDQGLWFREHGPPQVDEPATILMKVLKKTIAEYPVDPQRVYLTGVSAGGTACWEIGVRYPDSFAAIVPLSSAGGDTNRNRLARLRDVPIWAFHCTNDPATSPDRVRSTVSSLKELGGQVHLTELDRRSHDSWTSAFRDYHVVEWMLSHARGEKGGYPPGIVPWRWWHKAVVPVFAVVVVGLYFHEKKRRACVRNHSIVSDSN